MFLGAHAKGGFLKHLWGWVFDKVMPLCAHPPPELRAVHAQFWCGSHADTEAALTISSAWVTALPRINHKMFRRMGRAQLWQWIRYCQEAGFEAVPYTNKQ